jgi:hypothetical protein
MPAPPGGRAGERAAEAGRDRAAREGGQRSRESQRQQRQQRSAPRPPVPAPVAPRPPLTPTPSEASAPIPIGPEVMGQPSRASRRRGSLLTFGLADTAKKSLLGL